METAMDVVLSSTITTGMTDRPEAGGSAPSTPFMQPDAFRASTDDGLFLWEKVPDVVATGRTVTTSTSWKRCAGEVGTTAGSGMDAGSGTQAADKAERTLSPDSVLLGPEDYLLAGEGGMAGSHLDAEPIPTMAWSSVNGGSRGDGEVPTTQCWVVTSSFSGGQGCDGGQELHQRLRIAEDLKGDTLAQLGTQPAFACHQQVLSCFPGQLPMLGASENTGLWQGCTVTSGTWDRSAHPPAIPMQVQAPAGCCLSRPPRPRDMGRPHRPRATEAVSAAIDAAVLEAVVDALFA